MAQPDGTNQSTIVVKPNRVLSITYANWYTRLLNDLVKGDLKYLSHINSLLNNDFHPHSFITNVLDKFQLPAGEGIKVVFENDVTIPISIDTLHTNSAELADFFSNIKSNSFNEYFKTLAPITTCSLYLHGGTCPSLIVTGGNVFVAVKANLNEYFTNYLKITKLLDSISVDSKQIKTIPEIGLIISGNSQYFISKYMGFDYESEIIERKNLNAKDELLAISKKLETIFRDNNIFFRNLAPRNLIYGEDGKAYLIDFDNVYERNEFNKLKIYQKSLNRIIWFSDVCTCDEISNIFHDEEIPTSITTIMADEFEELFYDGRKEITFQEIEHIYNIVKEFECFDFYNNCEIYGHQLGRFISDFWNIESEVKLLKYLHHNKEHCKSLRSALYKLSRFDQELAFRQNYLIDIDKEFQCEKYFLEQVK